jgi:hypothetical protein
MIAVTPRARRNRDNAGDPLDGLVNMFDVGIVLAVAFLLAALSSLNLTTQFTKGELAPNAVTVSPDQTTGDVPDSTDTVIGTGSKVGSVYRLSDGRLVYVTNEGATSTPTSAPTPAPTSSR